MGAKKEILIEFIEWARDCGEDAWYIFDEPEEAVSRFIKEVDESDFDEND